MRIFDTVTHLWNKLDCGFLSISVIRGDTEKWLRTKLFLIMWGTTLIITSGVLELICALQKPKYVIFGGFKVLEVGICVLWPKSINESCLYDHYAQLFQPKFLLNPASLAYPGVSTSQRKLGLICIHIVFS